MVTKKIEKNRNKSISVRGQKCTFFSVFGNIIFKKDKKKIVHFKISDPNLNKKHAPPQT